MQKILNDAGYKCIKQTSKVGLFIGGKKLHKIYIRKTNEVSIVVPPDMKPLAEDASKGLGAIKEYHNSNMTAFPKKLNRGKKPIHYGYSVVFDTSASLLKFLSALDA